MQFFRATATTLLLHGLTSCGPKVHYETLAEDIARFCDMSFSCLASETPNYIERCEDELLDESTNALDEDADCADGFAASVQCLSNLTCEQFLMWDFAERDPDVDYSCKQENVRFLTECSSAWYADQA